MGIKPSAVRPRSGINKVNAAVDHLGNCVYCKLGIFSDQEHGRAQRPFLGKAHKECGGA